VIPYVLLILFGCSCVWLVLDGLKRRGGMFEFSFLAGCGLFGFLFVQAIGVVRNPGMAPEAGVWKALIMSTLCAAAVYLGWKSPAQARTAPRPTSPFVLKWMYRCGIVCIIVGLVGNLGLARLSGHILGAGSATGRQAIVFRGIPVMYYFLSVYGYLGLVLVASIALRLRSWLLALPAVVPLIFAFGNVVIAGRRNEFVLVGVAVGSLLYFARDVAPPRLLAVALAPLAIAAMFLAPVYRNNTLTGRWDENRNISVSESLSRVVSGSEGEFWTEAYEMEISDTEHKFQFGLGFYNTFVANFVPKLIVGDEFKEKLFVPVPSTARDDNHLGWVIPFGMVPTGPFSVFEQFWYFGAACYYFLAKWLKRHWIRAKAGDFLSALTYSVTVTAAVFAVTNDFFAIYIVFMFVVPLNLLARMQMSMRGTALASGYAAPPSSWEGSRQIATAHEQTPGPIPKRPEPSL